MERKILSLDEINAYVKAHSYSALQNIQASTFESEVEGTLRLLLYWDFCSLSSVIPSSPVINFESVIE